MGKGLCFIFLSTACLGMATVNAQNWVNGGNILSANGTLGTNSSHSLLFETSGLERGRITNGGNWGIGTASPLSKFAVNSAASTSPFRAQIAGVNKFIVNSNGGVTIGSSTAGPANGLYVAGNVGIGTTAPSYKFHVVGGGYFSNGLTVDNGIFSKTFSASGAGLVSWGGSSGVMARGTTYGVHGTGTSTTATNYGVYGEGDYGVYGSGGSHGVVGRGTDYGIHGTSTSTTTTNSGVYGTGYIGVRGNSTVSGGYGVFAQSGHIGVYGSGSSSGVYGASSNYAGYFAGKVNATGGYSQISDSKFKQNITELSSAMDIINKLQPKAYEYRQDGNYQLMNLPKGKHFGLIAQDLEEILPDLVHEAQFNTAIAQSKEVNPKATEVNAGTLPLVETEQSKGEVIDYKAVNYMELIPILVKGMQEQQQVIEKQQLEIGLQQQRIEKLEQLVSKLSSGQGFNTFLSSAQLGEAIPNPVKSTASIQYAIPEGSNRAHLLITDALGRQIKALQLSASGVIHIDVSTLASGMYNYSLIVDNKTVVTRKMTVVK
jgi:hypothetical protein